MSVDSKVAKAREVAEAARLNPTLLARRANEYLRLREQHNELTKQRKVVAEELMTLLEAAGGSYTAAGRRQRVYIDVQERYDYDPELLIRLVADGLLTEAQFAEALETTVSKPVLESWLKQGLVTEQDIVRSGAQSAPKVVRQIKVEKLKRAAKS